MPETVQLKHDTGPILVKLKCNPRAKRLILRLDSKSGQPVATCPAGISKAKVGQFLQNHVEWLVEKQQSQQQNVPFEHDATIPVRDVPHKLEHLDEARGTVRLLVENQQHVLLVSGNESHMARRVTDWLKKQARQDLENAVSQHAKSLNVKPSALRIKDTTSRWGSCSADRTLSFSWRVIMAPPHVLDYLAAHEVAHLREMNHSPRFWKLVEALYPEYEKSKNWLRHHGRALHAYGKEND